MSGRHSDGLRQVAELLAFAPRDRLLFDVFDGLYRSASAGESAEYRPMALMLGCVHRPSAESFEAVSSFFRHDENNPFLGHLADLGTLRFRPEDGRVYARAAEFARRYAAPKADLEFIDTGCSVSVVMPTYGSGRSIRESVESVLKQDHTDLELIVVNDGGSEDWVDLLDAFGDSRIRYQRIEHAGLAGALNAGLALASGRYVAYLDDDDVFHPQHLSVLLARAEAGARFVYSKSKVVHGFRDESGSFRLSADAGTLTLPYSKRNLATRIGINTLNVLHERALVSEVGLFNTALPWSMDWEYWMRVSDVTTPIFVDEWTGEYRRTLSNMTSSQRHKEEFFLNHLLQPYFTAAYGALTLYSAASLSAPNDREEWLERLRSGFVLRAALRNACASNPRLLRDWRLLATLTRAKQCQGEFSLGSLGRWAAGRLLGRAAEWTHPSTSGATHPSTSGSTHPSPSGSTHPSPSGWTRPSPSE